MILVNFKAYKESWGKGAVVLAKICKKVAVETGVTILPVVSALDAVRVMNEAEIEVILQSVDGVEEGAKTGYVSALAAKELGIRGALINHSEKKLKPGMIRSMLKRWPEGFEAIVCLQTLGQSERWAKRIKPTMMAYEPSYLIGSTDKSVASEESGIIKKMAEKYPTVPLLVGAGIKDGGDLKIALKMGARGVLVASAIVKDKDPYGRLLELAKAF